MTYGINGDVTGTLGPFHLVCPMAFNIQSQPSDHDPSFHMVTMTVDPGPITVSVFAHPAKTWQEIEFDITTAAERVLRSYVSAGINNKILQSEQ